MGKDLPDHVNESESHFSSMSAQSSEALACGYWDQARAGVIEQPPLPEFQQEYERLRAQRQPMELPIVRFAGR